MFTTLDENQIVAASLFASKGEKCWSCVEMQLYIPWFIASYKLDPSEDELEATYTMFLSSVEQIMSLNNRIGKITQISLISPSYMNNTKGWKLDTLKKIKMGKEDANNKNTYIFITVDDICYVDNALSSTKGKLKNIRTILNC